MKVGRVDPIVDQDFVPYVKPYYFSENRTATSRTLTEMNNSNKAAFHLQGQIPLLPAASRSGSESV